MTSGTDAVGNGAVTITFDPTTDTCTTPPGPPTPGGTTPVELAPNFTG